MRCTTAEVRDSVVGGVNSRTMFYEKPLGVCRVIAGSFLKNRKERSRLQPLDFRLQASGFREQPNSSSRILSYASISGITVVNHSVVCWRSLAVRTGTDPIARSSTGQALDFRN